MAQGLPAAGRVLEKGQRAGLPVAPSGRDRIMNLVRGIDEDLVQSEIRHAQMLVRLVVMHAVRVWPVLAGQARN